MKFTTEFVRLRKEYKLSHTELQKQLQRYGQTVSLQLLSKWENGKSFPNISQLFALCEIFQVENPADHFSDFRVPQLNQIGLNKLEEYREDLIASGRYSVEAPNTRMRPLYLLPASAGTGQFLDSSDYEMMSIPEGVPDTVDFGIRIAGDSMEPRYANHSIVWVQKADTLENGQIGVFFLNGDAYIKKLQQDEQGTFLISLNKKYEPIPICENADFRVFGKVVV